MASRRKPRPPQATAADYILSPRLDAAKLTAQKPILRRPQTALRSPRLFQEFISDDEGLVARGFNFRSRQIKSSDEADLLFQKGALMVERNTGKSPLRESLSPVHVSAGAPPPTQSLKQLFRDDIAQSSLVDQSKHFVKMSSSLSASSAYKRRPTNDQAVRQREQRTASLALVGDRDQFPNSRYNSLGQVLSSANPDHHTAAKAGLAGSPAESRVVIGRSEITQMGSGRKLSSTSTTEENPQLQSRRRLVVSKDLKRGVAGTLGASYGGRAELTNKRWTISAQPGVCIVHKPYIPEASLTRPHRQQTSQRVQQAVTQWAEEQKRLSVVHRRIFAAIRKEPAPPRAICGARVRTARINEAPQTVQRIHPRSAYQLGSPEKSAVIDNAPVRGPKSMLKRADTDDLNSWVPGGREDELLLSSTEERYELRPTLNRPKSLDSGGEGDDLAEFGAEKVFQPGPDCYVSTSESEVPVSHSDSDREKAVTRGRATVSPAAKDDSAARGPLSHVSFTGELSDHGGAELPGGSRRNRASSAVRKMSIKERRMSSRDRALESGSGSTVAGGGGGMSAVLAAIKLGNGGGTTLRGRRGLGKNAGVDGATAVDKIYGPAPPAELVPRKLNWLPMRPAQVSKTIWASLLQDDFNLVDLESVHQCGAVINGKGLCGGVNQCHSGGTGELVSARAILAVGRNTQPEIGEQNFNVSYLPIKIDPDYKSLDKYFFSAAKSTPSVGAAAAPPTKKRLGILDQRRIQNLQIALKGLGIYDDKLFIVQTVLDMNTVEVHQLVEIYRAEQLVHDSAEEQQPDGSGGGRTLSAKLLFGAIPDIKTPRPGVDASFTTEACGVLVKLVPSTEEVELLRQADVNDLTLAEQHLLEWSSVNRFPEKLECLSSVSIYVETYARIYAIASLMQSACSRALAELRTGHAFKAILAVILKCGNYLNYKRRKFALGVQYTSLDLLRRTTSCDESRTLLRHVSAVVDAKWPAIWSVLDEAFHVSGSMINLKELKGQLSLLEQRIRKICLEVTGHGSEHNELFVSVLSIFLDVSAKQISKLNAVIEQLQPELVALAELFLPEATDPEQGIDVLKFLHKFYRDLMQARDAHRDAVIQERIKSLRRVRK